MGGGGGGRDPPNKLTSQNKQANELRPRACAHQGSMLRPCTYIYFVVVLHWLRNVCTQYVILLYAHSICECHSRGCHTAEGLTRVMRLGLESDLSHYFCDL